MSRNYAIRIRYDRYTIDGVGGGLFVVWVEVSNMPGAVLCERHQVAGCSGEIEAHIILMTKLK